VSDTSLRNRRRGAGPLLLFLLAAALLSSGCPAGSKPITLPEADEKLVTSKGDPALLAAVRENGKEPFAAICVFGRDVFLGESAMLERSSITLLNEFGNAAFLLLRPAEVLPLLREPSVRRVAWFGPQGRLARLEPSLELDLLSRYGKGSEGKETQILARYRNVPGEQEERKAEAAGFRILSRGGPNLVLSGPLSGVPKLLADDWVIYLEKGTGAGGTSLSGEKATKEVPHSKESVSDVKERAETNPTPPQGGGPIPFRTYPRQRDDGAAPNPAPDGAGKQ
jgi:hypothetical protein